MSHVSRWLARGGLAVAFAASTAAAQAAEPISFLFDGHGTLSFAPCPVPSPTCAIATVSGVADDWAGMTSPIPGNWEVHVSRTLDLAAMTYVGTFAFADTGAGGNNLHGSVSGSWVVLTPGQTTGLNIFTVEGGSGIFSGTTGYGQSTTYGIGALGGYVESGIFNLTPVPEPATALLLGAGVLAFGAVRRRRN